MLTAEQINSIHRLDWAEHWSVRQIARHLHLARRTISQYLVTPARSAARRQRARNWIRSKPPSPNFCSKMPRPVQW
jgi:IS30 family transposase